MSFKDTKEVIDEGDTVVLYLGPGNMHSFEVREKLLNKKGKSVENVFQTIYGALKVTSLIGQRYGTKVQLSRGWGYVLQPTPELWTVTLPHRTQIIYTPDISMIVHLMGIVPGSVIIETGTGSGSLSHCLIRAVRPGGHLYTFDFHGHRASVAQQEFKSHGLEEFVTVECRDVCKDGFGEKFKNSVDAVFLDLPHPWIAMEYALDCLKKSGGKLCSFSPCIEQVQRTCIQLKLKDFTELHTYECLQSELTVHYRKLSTLQLECLKYKHTDDNTNDEKTDERKEEKCLTSTQASTAPGHTGFITIATLPPFYTRKTN